MNIPEFYRLLNIFRPYVYDLFRIEYNSIVDIAGHVGANGEIIHIDSYYDYNVQPTAQREGVDYVYSTTQAKSGHNGVTVISSSVPWDGTQATLADFLNGVGETDPTGTGCWVMKFQGYLTPYMAGAVGGGVIDDTAVVKKALAALASRSFGGVLRVDEWFFVSETIEISTASISIVGRGWNSGFTRSGDYGDTLYIHGNDTTGAVLDGFNLMNLYIKGTAKMTTGAHIHCNGVIRSHFDRIYTRDAFIHWQLDGLTQSYISNIFTINSSNYGEPITGRRLMQFGSATGAYAHTSSGGVWVDNYQLRNQQDAVDYVEYALNVIAADGLWFDNGHFGNASVACINISAVTSDLCNLLYFSNSMTDVCTGSGLRFEGNGTYPTDIKFTGCTFKGGGLAQYGVVTTANARAYKVTFSNCSIEEFKFAGVFIQSPDFRFSYFNNVNVNGNSMAAVGGSPGYNLAAGTRDIRISGGRSGGTSSNPAAVSSQSYGLLCSTGHSNVVVTGTDFRGNTTSSLSVPTGSGVEIIDVKTDTVAAYSTGTRVMDGRVGIGPNNPSLSNLLISKGITGGTTAYGQIQRGEVQSDVTSTAIGLYNAMSTAAAAFTLTNYYHFFVHQETIGAGSAVTNQYGYHVPVGLIGATNNYGFHGSLAAGAGRWNFYAAGTARNFFNGGVEVAAGETTMASGFTHIPAAAGAPTGAPTNPSGNVPLYYDTTNDKLYVYTGAAWKGVVLA